MRINHNIAALNTYNKLSAASNAQSNSMEKLSSGLRINSAADDAAGLAISEKMRGQIRGLDMAAKNSQDAISLIQTAEGGLSETHDILQRIRELTVQAGNTGTQDKDNDLQAIQDEIESLVEEIGTTDGNGIANRTQFNGKSLLDGSFASGTGELTFQIGANATQQLNINIADMQASALGTADGLKIDGLDVTAFDEDSKDFDTQLQAIDNAINQVSTQRSALGATQNRLEHTINNLSTSSENLTAAESRIRDVDYALAA